MSVQEQLGAAKEGERLAVLVTDRRVPDLRGATPVDTPRFGVQRPLERRGEEVRLQLDRREARRAVGQRSDAAVAAGRVRQSDHGAGVEVAVRREQLRPQRQVHAHMSLLDRVDLDPEQPRQPFTARLDKRLDLYFPATDETYLATALICASVSFPLNAGMTLPPLVTCFWTMANGGLS